MHTYVHFITTAIQSSQLLSFHYNTQSAVSIDDNKYPESKSSLESTKETNKGSATYKLFIDVLYYKLSTY